MLQISSMGRGTVPHLLSARKRRHDIRRRTLPPRTGEISARGQGKVLHGPARVRRPCEPSRQHSCAGGRTVLQEPTTPVCHAALWHDPPSRCSGGSQGYSAGDHAAWSILSAARPAGFLGAGRQSRNRHASCGEYGYFRRGDGDRDLVRRHGPIAVCRLQKGHPGTDRHVGVDAEAFIGQLRTGPHGHPRSDRGCHKIRR